MSAKSCMCVSLCGCVCVQCVRARVGVRACAQGQVELDRGRVDAEHGVDVRESATADGHEHFLDGRQGYHCNNGAPEKKRM